MREILIALLLFVCCVGPAPRKASLDDLRALVAEQAEDDGTVGQPAPFEPPLDGAGYWIVPWEGCAGELRLLTVRGEHPRAGRELVLWSPELVEGRYPCALWVSKPYNPLPLDSLGAPGCVLHARPEVEFGGPGRWPVVMPIAGRILVAQAFAVTEDGLRVSNAVALQVGP